MDIDEPQTQGSVPTVVDDNAEDGVAKKLEISSVIEFLRKHNLKAAEAALLKEVPGLSTSSGTALPLATQSNSNLISSYRSSEDPDLLSTSYQKLVEFVDSTLDTYKHELSLLLYPLFTHMYLNLVYNNHEEESVKFFEAHAHLQEPFYSEYLDKLRTVKKKEHLESDQLMSTFRSNKYTLKMARESFNHLKRYLQENKLTSLLTIVQDQLTIETYDGAPRTKMQTLATIGSLVGEARKDANKVKVFYGLLKEPEIAIPDDDEEADDADKPKKKSRRKDTTAMKKGKNDPNAPNQTRVPLPDNMRDIDKKERASLYKDSLKRAQLGPGSLPSICFYTFLNSYSGVSCATFADDCSMLAAGFEDSTVIVWSLSVQKLLAMKSGEALSDLDKDAEDIMERMMDESTASDSKTLVGHSGTIYSVCFSPDKHYLLSSAEDGTVRLWSLMTWTNLVCYKGHVYPVFDVQFSPYGYYFVSGGHDRLARLWSTDHYQPLRLFAGHYSDVECVKFHHNCNYVATGSSDRCVRLFDVLNGNCVRTMSGHKSSILCLAFSTCGRYLASGSADTNVHIWDLSNGTLISQLSEHVDAVTTLTFSREGTVLATGGMDNQICLWDLSVLAEERPVPDSNTNQLLELLKIPLLGAFPTKATPLTTLHFSRRNLLLGAGPFRN